MRDHFLIAILGVAIINGIFSPYLAGVVIAHALWYPAWLPNHISVVLFLSSLILATLTLMIAGVPAAIYERVTGASETDTASLWIWLAGAALISLPAIVNAISALR